MFEFSLPTRIVFGKNVINRVGELVKEYGKRIFLVTDAVTMQEAGYLTKVQKLLEEESHGVLLYNKVYSDSDSEIANKGADQARHARCDAVVGFGGKTTLNIAKSIAYLVSNGGNLEDYFLGKKGDKKDISYVEIPAGQGYIPGITNSFWVLDKFDHIKKSVEHNKNYADLVIMDPQLTTSINSRLTSAMSIEALSMSIESYISKSANPISDSFVVKAMEFIAPNVTKAITDTENINHRTNLCIGGVLSSLGLALSTPGTTFALALALNSVVGLQQGLVMTILLPHVMEFNLTSSPNRYVQIAKSFGEDVSNITVVEAAIKAIEAVRKILFDLKVPQRLSDLDIEKDDLFKAAKIARNYEFLHFLPRPVSKEDLHNILIAAY